MNLKIDKNCTKHLPKGTILSQRYEIMGVLGEGGFSITYSAIHIIMKKTVAIKEFFNSEYLYRDVRISEELQLLNSDYAPMLQHDVDRFISEAHTLSKFSDVRSIVHVTDFFLENNTAYMVMDLVNGETLDVLLRQGVRFTWDDISRKTLPLMEELSKIHKEGMIHGDIKPGNIIVSEDGSFTLIDFGNAVSFISDAAHSVYLTEGYAPIEQYRKKGKLGPYTDIYALSAVIYQCLTGIIPESSIQRTILDELRQPSAMDIVVPSSFETIIMKGLQCEPEERWQNISDFCKELKALLPSHNKRNRLLCIFLGVASFILIPAIIYCLSHLAELKVRFALLNGQATTFKLSSPSTMSAKEFADVIKQIEERADTLAGKHNYLLDMESSEVTLTIPDKYLVETDDWDKQQILSVIFAFSGNWLIHTPDMTQFSELTSDNIDSVHLHYGHVPTYTKSGENAFFYEPVDWTSEEECYYLELKVDDEISDFLADVLPESGYLFVVSAHFEEELDNSPYFFSWVAKGDRNTIYFPLGAVGTESLAETIQLMFISKGYKSGLKLVENIGSQQNTNSGKQDTNFSEQVVEISCSINNKKDFNYILQLCEGQLELLGIPNEVIEDDSSIKVRIPVEKTNSLINNFLFGASTALTTIWGEYVCAISSQDEIGEIEIYEENDDIYLAISDLNNVSFSGPIDVSPEQLFLCINQVRVGILTSVDSDSKELTFRLLLPKKSENEMISSLIMAKYIYNIIISEDKILDSKTLSWFDKDGREIFGDEIPDINPGLDIERFSVLFDAVSELGGEAKYSPDPYDERITISFEHWNGDFPEDALAMIEKIYKEQELDKNICPTVTFVIKSWYHGNPVGIEVYFVEETQSRSVIAISGTVECEDEAILNTAKMYIENSQILNTDKNRTMDKDSFGGYYTDTDWRYVKSAPIY